MESVVDMESAAGLESRIPLSPLTPSQQNIKTVEMDFSKLTPSQFGITTQSFSAFPEEKDRTRVAQLKSRRRSTVGVRGSPETNSLICFRAQQAMKTPPRTPQHLLASPLLSGCDSIKQKMAAFRRLMEEDEENVEQTVALTKDEDIVSWPEDEENQPFLSSLLSPASPVSKRRRKAFLNRGLWEEEIQEEPLGELQHTPKQEQQERCLELKSLMPSPGLGSDSQSQLLSLPMLSKPRVSRRADFERPSTSKRKRVRFGAPLSPEFFDKTLPPSTPLQKGASPLCPPSSVGQKHSLLKLPQIFDPPLPQPDFGSPRRSRASPVRRRRRSPKNSVDNKKILFSIPDHPQAVSTEPYTKQSPPRRQKTKPLGRKRKQQAESEPETRRSSRSAAASAKGRMTASAAKKRFGSKEVDRSLYGKRDYASKNPLLSPIDESTYFSINKTPARPVKICRSPTTTASSKRKKSPTNSASGLVASPRRRDTEAMERQRERQQEIGCRSKSLESYKEDKTRCADEPTTSWKLNQIDQGTSKRGSPDGKGQVQVKKGRRSQRVEFSYEEEGGAPLGSEPRAQGLKTAQDRAKQDEDVTESSVGQGGPALELEPWQQPDFNIEEILKPVAKSRASVRRSLRNRRSTDVLSRGLAWVDRTSPQTSTSNRRRTGGQQSKFSRPTPADDAE